MNRRCLLHVMMVCACMTAFMSCHERTVYIHYESTSVNGWERNDTLTFHTDTVKATGPYKEDIGVRISGEYPFLGLSLVVEQRVIPSGRYYSDTLRCTLLDEVGHAHGRGISHYQYVFPFTTLQLSRGESVRVSIYHCMKREILPGILDVGVQLSRQVPAGIQTQEDEEEEGEAPQ